MADTSVRRRVKLYMLSEGRTWDDQGTGHVSSAYVDRLAGMSLLVRSEEDGSILLESKIQELTAYQKQQDTLIVWSEVDRYDYALSFQEKAGCDEIWEKICQVQGKDPSIDITQDVLEPEVDDMEEERLEDLSSLSFEIPPCELSRLEEISELFNGCLVTPTKKERLAAQLEMENYIKKLLDLFHMCEDLENVEGLHHLYEIFKSIILLNKNSLFEIMFADDVIFDVVGVLEYDPVQPKPLKHREYLRTQAVFKEVIPIQNQDLLQKIHQTYRVQYIQEVILPTPSVFEENMLSTLTSFVFFNKVEIVSMIQEDEKFLPSLFEVLTDDETDDEKRKDCIFFLKEFCTFSQTLQAPNRDAFFKTLSHMGILGAIEMILGLEDSALKSTAIDIFSYIVEYNPSLVREHILSDIHPDDEDLLINLVIEQMISDNDPELGGAVQLMGIIRLLIDPENMLGTTNKTEKTEFLTFFYKNSMHVLTAPLFANTVEEKPSKDDYQTCQLLALTLELLTFCIEHHTFHIRNYVTKKDLLRRVLVLLRSKHSFLALSALRLLRRTIGLKDECYNRYIVNGDLFKMVVDAFTANGTRYNLLNSALIELFEFIRQEDIRILNTYIVEKHMKAFEHVDYVATFKGLVIRFDNHKNMLPDVQDKPLDSMQSLVSSRFRREARAIEEEEEIWFNEDDEFDGENIVPMSDMLKTKLDSGFDQINRLIIDKTRTSVRDGDFRESPPRLFNRGSISFNIGRSPPGNGPTPTPTSSPIQTPNSSPSSKLADSKVPLQSNKSGLVGLVDYPDEDSDEEEEEEDEDGEFHVSKRPRLAT